MAFAGAVEGEFADELFAVEHECVVAGDECGDGLSGVFDAEGDDRVLGGEVAVAAAGAAFDDLGGCGGGFVGGCRGRAGAGEAAL